MMQLANSNAATAIAVTGATRALSVPDVPTIAESGVPGYALEQWWGLVVPAGTPADIVAKLNREVTRILATPDVAAFMAREGAEPTPSTPEALGKHIALELQRWSDLVARAGLKPQE
jgi:tripartite-type tricarboxylate transporter receptor subunit TctC